VRESRYNVKELQRAIDYFKDKVGAVDVKVTFDDLGRLSIQATDISGQLVTIKLFDADNGKLAEITKTDRF
jgi:hypothetical protein